ncbi:MAG: phytoene/squalene synthase family protein [Candidatus Omnitrophica bacterium]|jgi:phytoene synthase|nr:phytoene/squalene synthase family protein [Candidatus Omnitrophota bacterium]
MPTNAEQGFLIARGMTKKCARNFYSASLFLPKEERMASFAVYAVCRISDQAVDSPANGSLENIQRVQRIIDSCYQNTKLDSALLFAFRDTILKYNIPKEYFDKLLEGMRMDLTKKRYANFTQLDDYCYKAAGVIGLIMLKIFHCDIPEAKEHAINLGKAMQLTNILRDIKEDFALGRIYLPGDELSCYKITEEQIRDYIIDDNFRSFLKFQIARAREYYQEAEKGIYLIKNFRFRLVIGLMSGRYRHILKRIERNILPCA